MLKKFHSLRRRIGQMSDLVRLLMQGCIESSSSVILSANILSKMQKIDTDNILKNLHLAEFKVFSQWGDDGIIQFLVNYLEIENKTFVEFGVESYIEANTRFLLINNNWKGLIIDGSGKNIRQVQREDIYWKYDLTAVHAFVTRENINSLLRDNKFSEEIGLLHIDTDGNDYWIWKEINCVSPVIVIMEYNSVFGAKNPWTISYDKDFNRANYHHSNLYFGSSLLSLCDLAEEKGYYFVGCNSNGNNAYFVRKDKIKALGRLNAEDGYVASMFRESRNESGQLTYVSGNDRIKLLQGMEIFNTRTRKVEKIYEA